MGKPSTILKADKPTLDKWKLIQFAELDLFQDSDEELKTIGMTSLDIRLFREWQKQTIGSKIHY